MNKPRKAKSRRILPLPLDTNETKCGICLDLVVKRGKIGPCSHLYCFTCLLEWSKLNNTCPQCKLTFRCISRIDFKTDKFEEKVFIKDKTLRTGHVSSDEEYYVNSSEIEDSDPDFIDYNDVPDVVDPGSGSEPEAQFTQRKRKCTKTPPRKQRTKRRSKAVIFSDSETDEENDNSSDGNAAVHLNIIGCCQSPDLFEKSPKPGTTVKNFADKSPQPGASVRDSLRSPASSRYNCKFDPSSRIKQSPVSSPKSRASPSSARRAILSSPQVCKYKSPDRNWRSPQSPKYFFASPKLSKSARWASLNQKVKSLKRRRRNNAKVVSKRSTIAIKTLSPGNNTDRWLSTSTHNSGDKENVTPNKSSVNSQFKVPFKKNCSPGKLFDDPEQYFASIINNDS